MKATRLRELCDAAVKYSATVAADGPHHHERVSDVFDLAAAAREYAAAPALPEILSALEQAEKALKEADALAEFMALARRKQGYVSARTAEADETCEKYLLARLCAHAALREVMGGGG